MRPEVLPPQGMWKLAGVLQDPVAGSKQKSSAHACCQCVRGQSKAPCGRGGANKAGSLNFQVCNIQQTDKCRAKEG